MIKPRELLRSHCNVLLCNIYVDLLESGRSRYLKLSAVRYPLVFELAPVVRGEGAEVRDASGRHQHVAGRVYQL